MSAIPTHETLTAHFQAVKSADLEKAAQEAKAAGAAATLPQLCPLYKAAKPLLAIVVNFPFFPTAWKQPVVLLMGVFDAICP